MILDFIGPLKSALKLQTATIDNTVFRLHYRLTAFLLLAAALLVTGTQYFGDPIDCMIDKSAAEKVIDTFCWTHFTYSVAEAFDGKVGEDISYPGVSNQIKNGKKLDLVHHTYYQWVWFILFFQAGLFYFPRYLWKVLEGGKIKALTEGLSFSAVTKNSDDAMQKLPVIVNYLTNNVLLHRMFAIKYIICEAANFVNVVCQIFLLDAFLGGEFLQFGVRVIEFALMEDNPDRSDPLIRIFPRMTKCRFYHGGPTADVQKTDAFCILPLNIINEKVFIFAWFWFVVLATITGIALIYRAITVISPTMRTYCLKAQCTLADDACLDTISRNIPLGDWFLLYLLTKNMQPIFMKDVLKQLECKLDNQPNMATLKVENSKYESKNHLIDEEISYV